MTQRRSLNLKLVLSVFAAFLLSMAFTWFLHSRLSERDAYKLIDRTFENVEDEMSDCVEERLVLQCMAVRERIEEDGYPVDTASLQALARELHVTEISVADVEKAFPAGMTVPSVPVTVSVVSAAVAARLVRPTSAASISSCSPLLHSGKNSLTASFSRTMKSAFSMAAGMVKS